MVNKTAGGLRAARVLDEPGGIPSPKVGTRDTPVQRRPEKAAKPPSGTIFSRLLDDRGDVIEGRGDRFKRMNARRSLDGFRQELQHFRVDAGVVVVGVALVLPQTD